MKRLFLILALIFPLSAAAQTCNTATCNAASASQTDVLAALPSTCPTGTTVVNIPTSTSHWVSPPGQMTYTIPANCTNLTIQGNTAVNCTGTPGTAGYSCSATDNTVIIDDITANFGVLQINGSSGTTPLVRVTGLTIQNGSGSQKFQGLLLFYSNAAGSQIRMDHNHFNLTTGTSGTGWAGRLNNCFTGVADHNRFDNASPTNTGSVAQGFMNSNTCNSSDPYGDGSWATATGFGGSNFFFYEANDFEGGLFGDCVTGGKFVVRYNTFNSDSKSSSWIHNHGTTQNGGRDRSCRAFEAYNNYLNPATAGSAIIGDAGGTGLIWGNALSRTSAVFLAVGDQRNDGQHSTSPTPGAWGYCGIGTLNPSGPISNWDENVDSTGRACLDGIGRGFDVQALNGANFPSALNSITGTIAWPQEYLEPVYAFMNTLAGTTPYSIASPATAINRDMYVDNASCVGGGACASGTGFGTTLPTTCTAGPGGSFGTSPTGSYGTGFFLTTTQTFYACTATNTWTSIYTPYTYPHPLANIGGTINAASCSEADVQTALNAVTSSTTRVNIPAGTCTWTSDLNWTVPAGNTNLTIQGSSTINWTGTPGQSSWNYSLNDQTIIQDADPTNNSLWFVTTGPSSTKFTLAGITFRGTASQGTKYAGTIGIGGSSRNVRLTSLHIDGTSFNSAEWIQTTGSVTGVADHNVFYDGGAQFDAGNMIRIYNSPDDTIGFGDGAWLNGPQFGTLLPFFYESNYFYGGISNDCINGGRFTARYNTFDSNYTAIQTHGTKTTGGGDRSCVSYEAYNNYITHPSTPDKGSGAFGAKGGTALIFNNTMASNSYYTFFTASTDRYGGDNAPETNPPNGWGYCSTSSTVNPANTGGAFSNWDGNQPTNATGYPCLDQIGRGQDTQALNGLPFPTAPATTPTRLNTVTGNVAWPHQYVIPVYMWNNTIPTSNYANVYLTTNNRDFYYDQSAQSGSFTGAAGTGFGTHTQRIALAGCTAGGGGTYLTSPTGSYGVGFWETDTSTFWVCTSTNTWTQIYTPAAYPHPLVSGVTTVSLTVSTSGTGSGIITGTNCTSGSKPSGTAIGPCTATATSGTFTGWSSTGSASCSGTGTCPSSGSFSLGTNTTITATFTGPPALSTPTFTPSSGVPPQTVVISSTDTTTNTGISVTEGSNANASNGSAVHRNAYTNCATSCISGVWQPVNSGSVSNGQLACTTAAQSSGVTNGCTARSVVSATITGTGTTALSNGNGAGGDDSLTALTVTYGGPYAGACPGMNGPSALLPNVILPGGVANAETVYSGTTDSVNFNTSLLAPTKWAFASGDNFNSYVRQTCQTVPTTTGTGFHLEFDLNHTLSTHEYIGPGIHYNYTDSKWYFCFQGCGGWTAMQEVEFNGTIHTTLPFPAGHDIYTEFYYDRTLSCAHTSGSNCEFIRYMCEKDFTAGGSLVCYNLQVAGTGAIVGGIPVLESGFTASEFNLQHQLDFDQGSITRSVNVHYDNAIAFNQTSPTFCYTNNGTTPAATTPGTCSTGTTYTGPIGVTVNPTTLQAIATKAASTNSAVATATYSGVCGDPFQTGPNFSGAYNVPPTVLPLSIGFTNPTPVCTMHAVFGGSAANCSSPVYSGSSSISSTTQVSVIACQSGFTSSNLVGGTWIINGGNPAPPPITVIMISENAERELRNIREWRGFR